MSISQRLHDLGFKVVARVSSEREHDENLKIGDIANLPHQFTCRGLHFVQERHVDGHLTEYHADTRHGLMYVNFVPDSGKIEIQVGLEVDPGEEDSYVETEDINVAMSFDIALKKIRSMIENRLERAED